MLQNENGFTLIELIVVVAIISLLMGFAIPRLDGFLSEDNSKKEIRKFCSLAKELRGRAVKDKKDYILVLSPSSNEYWVEPDDEKKLPKKFSTGKRFSIKGAQIQGYDFSRAKSIKIRFYKKGYNDPFVIVFTTDTNQGIYSVVFQPFLSRPSILNKIFTFDRFSS